MTFQWIDLFDWGTTLASIYAFYERTMIPLRIAAIAASLLSLVFAGLTGDVPAIILNVVLLPLNVTRLVQMRRLIADVKAASNSNFDTAWITPYMHPIRFPAGAMIFAKGDIADHAYVIVSGTVQIPEVGADVPAGLLLGEMGLFTSENRRTASAHCETDVSALTITYEELEQLCFQNPTFGFFLMKLIGRRFEANMARLRSAG